MDELSLVIPAKQEPNSLPVVLKELDKLNLNKIIVLKENDKETIDSVKNLNCDILFQTGTGYGNAIRQGISKVNTKYTAIYYADGSTDPKYLNKMLEKIKIENNSIVFGSRYMKDAGSFDDDIITKIGNFIFTSIGNIFFSLKISDLLFTYIVAETEVLRKMELNSDNYNLCVEIPIKAKSMKLKYDCFPCIERKRFADKKKVKAFKVGFEILWYLTKSFFDSNFIYRK